MRDETVVPHTLMRGPSFLIPNHPTFRFRYPQHFPVLHHQSSVMGSQPQEEPGKNDPEQFLSCQNPEFQYLLCVICEGVYSDPLQCPSEHYFCRSCITTWLSRSQTCPIDRSQLAITDLKPAPRVIDKMISSLQVRCRFHLFGCNKTPSSESLSQHVLTCDYRRHPLRDHDYPASHTSLKKHHQPQEIRPPVWWLAEELVKQEAGGRGDDGRRLLQRLKFDAHSFSL